jgi:hypothetical protein
MLILGQGEPSGMVSGNWGGASVHGQPILLGRAGGKSAKVGQPTVSTFDLPLVIGVEFLRHI